MELLKILDNIHGADIKEYSGIDHQNLTRKRFWDGLRTKRIISPIMQGQLFWKM